MFEGWIHESSTGYKWQMLLFYEPIFGCKDNDSSSEDSHRISDCNSEEICNSDSTESFISIVSSMDTVSVGGTPMAYFVLPQTNYSVYL
jgi:hypothetical protein